MAHQIAGCMRTAIVVPLPEHPRRQTDDKLLRINLKGLWMPNSQRLLFIESHNETIILCLGLNNRVIIVVGFSKPNTPKPQGAAVNIWKMLLDVCCHVERGPQLLRTALLTAKELGTNTHTQG